MENKLVLNINDVENYKKNLKDKDAQIKELQDEIEKLKITSESTTINSNSDCIEEKNNE